MMLTSNDNGLVIIFDLRKCVGTLDTVMLLDSQKIEERFWMIQISFSARTHCAPLKPRTTKELFFSLFLCEKNTVENIYITQWW